MDRNSLLDALDTLAKSHTWTWSYELRGLFDGLADGPAHPVATVAALDDDRLDALLADDEAIGVVQRAIDSLTAASARTVPVEIAYFSPEFGISELVPQYSGGLGILAGDHVKASNDLAIPLVGVGLFYREGFFRQDVADGHQVERYECYEPSEFGAVEAAAPVDVPIADRDVTVRIWQMSVGQVQLVLLDTDHPDNSPEDRCITDRLYSGDRRHRIEQELVLGVGGVRALDALGLAPHVFHLNEGHAGFLILELLDRRIADGESLDEAARQVRRQLVFTTHTPVPAGIDRFPRRDLVRAPAAVGRCLAAPHRRRVRARPGSERGAARVQHGGLLPALVGTRQRRVEAARSGQPRAVRARARRRRRSVRSPTACTLARGPHRPSRNCSTGRVARRGPTATPTRGDVSAISTTMRFATCAATGGSLLAAMVHERTGTTFDPDVLTVGFARRFATYKRATLLLRHRDRLVKLLADDSRPIQFVFAGKAHPNDDPGKALLAEVVAFAASADALHRFVFVADYDIEVARAMYAGCDVWLNNPVRPHEASGTSGEKSALNGGLNCSISDGWWDEMADGRNGWTIPASASVEPAVRDRAESAAALDLLAGEIVPTYYRDGEPMVDGVARPGASLLDRPRAARHRRRGWSRTTGSSCIARRSRRRPSPEVTVPQL